MPTIEPAEESALNKIAKLAKKTDSPKIIWVEFFVKYKYTNIPDKNWIIVIKELRSKFVIFLLETGELFFLFIVNVIWNLNY